MTICNHNCLLQILFGIRDFATRGRKSHEEGTFLVLFIGLFFCEQELIIAVRIVLQ